MPVGDKVPEPLKSALEEMESTVQDFKKVIGYVAPEAQDGHWAQLQMDLANTMAGMVGFTLTNEPEDEDDKEDK